MLINPKASINTKMQELSIDNLRTQLFHRKWRSDIWLWVTPTINPLINKTTTANIIARYQTNVKIKHQINVQGDTTYVKGKLYKLRIADLLTDQAQARKFMDPVGLNELTESIIKYGVLTPILFCQNAEVKPVVVAGHRRVAASLQAGLTEVPGTFTDGDTRLQGFVENIQREGLTPIEEAEEMDALMKEYVMNKYQLADALGKSKSSIYDSLTLNKLPEDIRSACRTNPNISKNLLLEVARQKTESNMRRKFETLMTKAANAGKVKTPTTPKPLPSAQRLLITKTDELTGEFMEVPWQEWSEDDRNDLINALYGIRRQTDRLLVDMDAPPQEGEQETTGGGSNLA